MRRVLAASLAIALAVVGFGVSACGSRVTVETGNRVVCTYGETISEQVHSAKVPPDEAGRLGVKTVTKICDRHAKAERLYAQAQAALVKGNVKTAQAALTKVVEIDSGFRLAQTQLDTIVAGKKPAADGNTSTTTNGGTGTGSNSSGNPPSSKPAPSTPGDKGKPVGPIASLTGWTPATLSGYSAQKLIADPLVLSRQYVPSATGSRGALVIVAEQVGNANAAKSRLSQEMARYSKDDKTTTINGRSVRLGTDGESFAALGILDGPVIVILEMDASTGSPTALLPQLTEIAKQLPVKE
jgi:hypothetical protein